MELWARRGIGERAPDLFATELAVKRWVAVTRPDRGFEIGEYRPRGGKAVRFVVRRDHPMPRAALEAVAGELAHYKGPPDRHEAVRLPARRVIPIDARFLADLRPLAPGSGGLVPAILLDLYPKYLGGNPEVMVQ